eukprot:3641686-Amphidinium_carterae.1
MHSYSPLCVAAYIRSSVPQAHGVALPCTTVLRHASMRYNLKQLGENGCTPWQRIKGKQFGKALIPFAKVVMWHCGGPSRYEGYWEHGIFLGIYRKNGQHLMGIE